MITTPLRTAPRRLAAAGCLLALFASPVRAADPWETASLHPPAPAAAWHGAASPCADTAAADRPWTLARVIDQALCHNPQTRETWANARAQAAQLGVARAAELPTLDLSAKATRARSGTSATTTNSVTPTLSASYLLFDFGARSAAVENARQALYAADWSHNATLQQVTLAAVNAYYGVAANTAAVTAARASERASAKAYTAARVRHRIGDAALADALQARTAYSQATLKRQQAERDLRIARGTLANVLGLAADTPLTIAAPSDKAPGAGAVQQVHALIAEAERARPDLRAALAQVRAARAQVDAAAAGGRPTLSLVANRGRSFNDPGADADNWSVGLQLSVPLFSGFATTYKVQAAKAQLQASEAKHDTLARQVALDVWKAYQNLNTALDSYRTSEDLYASAAESARVALGRYKAGAGSLVELLNAQAALADARRQRIQARYDWYTGRAALARAVGRLGPTTVLDNPNHGKDP